jgi:hypothetical protein
MDPSSASPLDLECEAARQRLVQSCLDKQDEQFRWMYEEALAQERPELADYLPKYSSTLWTLILLADLQAPPDEPRLQRAFEQMDAHFFDPAAGIYSLGRSHFPIPCLNGNMLYLHFYLRRPLTERVGRILEFFDIWQRFDDGGFRTPRTYPYLGNRSCYGSHTCYWGIAKLVKGISFIPAGQRPAAVQRLLENGIEFILSHEVCFRSREKEKFINPFVRDLTFPNLIHADFLELLWLLAREGVRDRRVDRAVELLRSRQRGEGKWMVERPNPQLIIRMDNKSSADTLITERARQVMRYYEAHRR